MKTFLDVVGAVGVVVFLIWVTLAFTPSPPPSPLCWQATYELHGDSWPDHIVSDGKVFVCTTRVARGPDIVTSTCMQLTAAEASKCAELFKGAK